MGVRGTEGGRRQENRNYGWKGQRESEPRTVLVNLSGRGDKDMDYMIEHYGTGDNFHA